MAGIQVIRADHAPMSGGDPTRRYGVTAGGPALMPGLTRDEAARACEWLAGLDAIDHSMALAEVSLPVVLTDGAGPHLLDAAGQLVLVLGGHPALPDAHLAMGQASAGSAVGLARPIGGGGWAWLVRAEVPDDGRIEALDELDGVAGWAGARDWAQRWTAAISTLAP